MGDNNKISVLMAVYNSEKYLKEAIDSILNQTFKDFDFFIVEDASTDSSAAILSQYTDSRIKIITNETNKGLTSNLNLMLSICSGKYIARMDADDIALPNRFQIQYDYMESHPEIGICGSSVDAFFEGTKKKQTVDYASEDSGIRAFAFFQSPFCHPTVMIRKEVLDKNQLQYPLEYRTGQDYALWIELLKVTQCANLPVVLLRFRKHEESVSTLGEKKEDKKMELINTIHQRYLAQYDLSLSPEDLLVYSRFVDRSIPSDLTIAVQNRISEILNEMFIQLTRKYNHIQSSWMYYLSSIGFYNFFVEKKIPSTSFLRKLYYKGAFIYLKRSLNKQIRQV
jgi:glycosyltransferase involved in cell wall biosynthesis